MAFTGGMGERYCSQTCYDAGGATVTKHLLEGWSGDCSVCRGPVILRLGARASMVCSGPGQFLFHCGSPTCVLAVREHVRQEEGCAVCGSAVPSSERAPRTLARLRAGLSAIVCLAFSIFVYSRGWHGRISGAQAFIVIAAFFSMFGALYFTVKAITGEGMDD